MPGMTVTDEILTAARKYQAEYRLYGHEIPSIAGMSLVLGIPRTTINNLRELSYNEQQDPLKVEFSGILEEIHTMQEVELLNKGLVNTFNPTLVKLALTKHGYSDKQDNTIANPDGTPLDTKWQVEIVDPAK